MGRLLDIMITISSVKLYIACTVSNGSSIYKSHGFSKGDGAVPPKSVLYDDIILVCLVQQSDPIYYTADACDTTTVEIELWTISQQFLSTYSRPTANTAETPSFLFTGICRLQIEYRGRARMQKSETMFHAPEKSELALGLRHFPGTVGSQIFSRGLQANISQKKTKR